LHHRRDKASGHERQLLENTLSNSLAKNDMETVIHIISNEFNLHGILDANYNSNDYGRELEELLDFINRPRLEP
jgi:hypothetical protein